MLPAECLQAGVTHTQTHPHMNGHVTTFIPPIAMNCEWTVTDCDQTYREYKIESKANMQIPRNTRGGIKCL